MSEEQNRLAERVKAGVLGIFVNDRDAFLDLLDEESVLVGAGSKVFNGRESFESSPNRPDEATVVGTYLLSGPCINGTVNQRVTVNLRKSGDDWRITLAHFSNEWPMGKPGDGAQKAASGDAPRRLQLRSESGIIFVDPEEIVYAESSGKRSIVHLKDRDVTVCALLHELCEMLPSQFVRANRFYIVNVRHVQEVGRDGILFVTGERVSIPERRVKEIQLQIASAVSRNFN